MGREGRTREIHEPEKEEEKKGKDDAFRRNVWNARIGQEERPKEGLDKRNGRGKDWTRVKDPRGTSGRTRGTNAEKTLGQEERFTSD